MPKLGELVGERYEIFKESGSGGFSKTYLARDTIDSTASTLVVKQLQLRFNNAALRENIKERFIIEANVLKRLGNHDRIPQLFAHIEENEEFYLIQEFIDGEEFKQEISQQALDEAQIVHFLKDVLEILAFVHQQGVIHRDIKPSNLIRRQRDRKMVLIDFGAVKEIETLSFDAQTQTIITKAIGTPGYMAPEQRNGKPVYSSDLFALGRTAIHALTKQSPTELEDTQTGDLENWEDWVQVSPNLSAILNKMIHPKLVQRYHSALEVLQDIEPLLKLSQVIGRRYKVTSYLGGSKNSYTYIAENLWRTHQSPCLVKQLQPQNSDPTVVEEIESYLLKQIDLLEKLGNYPQIPHLWDHFEQENSYYLVQEYIEGEPLDREIQKHQYLSEETVIALLQDVLETLAFIHQQQITHGNIKPTNLIRQQDNKIVVTDFSLIKAILNWQTNPSESERSETTAYLAPEQIAENPTQSSDFYALGAIAIEALTGTSLEKIPRTKTDELIWQQSKSTNPKLLKILEKMVRLDSSKRYHSASQILKELKDCSKFPNNSQLRKIIPKSSPKIPVELLKNRFNLNWCNRQKTHRISVLLIGISILLGGWELWHPTWRPMFMVYQSDRLLKGEQPKQAFLNFQKILELNPNNQTAWKGKGKALLALENDREALEAYERAISLQSDDPQAWVGRGNALARLERYEEALKAYEKALDLQPRNPETLNRQGQVLRQLERYREALTAQEEALNFKHNYIDALRDRAEVLIDLQRYEEAIASYEQVQKMKPRDPRFWQDGALALQRMGRDREALAVYNQVIAAYDRKLANKVPPTVWVERGDLSYKLQRWQDGIAAYEKALQIKPDSYLAWRGKANTLFALKNYDEALAAFERSLEIRPESYLAWYERGLLMGNGKKNWLQAITSYEKAIGIAPNFYHAWRERGLALSQVNRPKEAIASFDEALKIEPNDYQAWIGRGIALSALNRRTEALTAFNKAIEIQPLNSAVWMSKGKILEQWGRLSEAQDIYKKARDIASRFQPS